MHYVRNSWYVAAWTNDVATDKPSHISILGEPIALWRSEGKIRAFADRCVHRMAPLSRGRIEGSSLRCMYHGFLFGADGKVISAPGQDVIPDRACVRVYPVVEKNSWVWVWMGDLERADEALIPDSIGLDDPDWALAHGYLDYDAEAYLINDNLLDLSHVAFVHAASFRVGDGPAALPPKVTPLENGVRFQTWLPDIPNRPFFDRDGAVDMWQQWDFLVPGLFIQKTVGFPQGSALKAGGINAPEYTVDDVSSMMCSNQAVTPMGPRKARYFFSIGPHRKFGGVPESENILAITQMAFAEDKAMIEAQQAVIDGTPEPSILPSVHDKGVTIYNNLVKRLSQADC